MEVHKLLETFTADRSSKPDYPINYCNAASRSLKKVLEQNGIETEFGFTYEEPGSGHTFLIDKDGVIIDPTYGQFDAQYPNGFVGKEFPNTQLQINQINAEEYMKLQLQRAHDGFYSK